MTTLTSPSQNMRKLTLRRALMLEIKGMKHSRGSAYATIKREFNLKGNKQSVLEQFTDMLRKEMPGVIRD